MPRILPLALAALALLVGALIAPSAASALDPTRPLVLVHGTADQSSTDCPAVWGDLMNAFHGAGYAGPIVPVTFYADDVPCTSVPGGGRSDAFAQGTSNTSIESLSASFAWWVYFRFTSRGVPINVVAHSMGGLIVRYAVDQVQKRNPYWPPALYVTDVATLASPHGGIDFGPGGDLCIWFSNTTQCRQMAIGSPFIRYLQERARDPQTSPWTSWANAGSDADSLVRPVSATDMDADYKIVWPASDLINHNLILHATAPLIWTYVVIVYGGL